MCEDKEHRPISRPIRVKGRQIVLTKQNILDAQSQTMSATEAARWLGVAPQTYKKNAKIYGIYEQHLNPKGYGIKKGLGKWRIPLDDILSGKHQRPKQYSNKTFKKRLIEEGYFQEECSLCGYNEENFFLKRTCLKLDFIDNNYENVTYENIRLLCPNCYLSTNGRLFKTRIFCD